MSSNDKTVSRRAMLAKLGLVAAGAYTAPVLLQLSEARASSSFSGEGGRRYHPRHDYRYHRRYYDGRWDRRVRRRHSGGSFS